MIFSFEALNAKYGDCLLLHFGKPEKPRLVVIDGGPKGVFHNSLLPRLLDLRQERGLSDEEVFKTDLLMVSHIDDDHICGVLDWFVTIALDPDQWQIAECWFNSFPDVVGRARKIKTAALDGEGNRLLYPNPSDEARSIVASVNQGRQLRDHLDTTGIRVNGGKDILFAPDSVPVFSKDGMKLTLLAPNQKAVERLEKKWEDAPVKTAALDNAVENLSSLVVMAECNGRSILLTGDARGDYIIQGLEDSGYLKDGKCKVNILKLPHHGSSRNCTEDLFKTVEASHYVISANGKYDNPDSDTLCLLAKVRGEAGNFTVHMTNAPDTDDDSADGKKLYQNVEQAIQKYPWLNDKLAFGSAEKPIRIDL
jgi:hypothetical protein